MEDVIIGMAREEYNWDIKLDKRTFVSDTYDFVTANIDGYIGTDINNVEEIIEIKNTTTTIPELIENYKYQVNFYMWFFNCHKATLIALQNGNKLVHIPFRRDPELVEEMLQKSKAYKENGGHSVATNNEEISFEDLQDSFDDTPANIDLTEDQERLNYLLETFEEYEDTKADAQKEIKMLSEAIHEDTGTQKTFINHPNYQITMQTIHKNGSVDWRKLADRLMIGMPASDVKNLIEEFTKPGSSYTKMALTKKDGE